MKHQCTLLAVTDMARARWFYQEVLGLRVTADFGANITLDGTISLQTIDTWKGLIRSDSVILRSRAGELYFEEADLDTFVQRLERMNVELAHPLTEHSWGQRAVRFYDPDGHMIEVGEEMTAVVRRFADHGMTALQIAERMDVPLDYVQERLNWDKNDMTAAHKIINK